MTITARDDLPDPHLPPTVSFLALPTELKSRIAALLAPTDAHSLALTCKTLVDIGESPLWQDVKLFPSHASFEPKLDAGSDKDDEGNDDLSNRQERLAKESSDQITEAWDRLGRALLARPARYKHIHALSYMLLPQNIPVAARIITSLPCLRRLDETALLPPNRMNSLVTVLTENEAWRNPSFTLIQQCGPLSTIQRLKLDVNSGSRNQLFRALHKLPNLVELSAEVHLPDKPSEPIVKPPRLEHLEILDLSAHDWPSTFGPIVKRAPRLAQLSIWEDKVTRHKKSAHLNAVFRSETVRVLLLGQEMWDYVLKPKRVVKDWLPNLEVLSLLCAPTTDCVPQHPNLRLLNLHDWEDCPTVPFGSAGNSDVSGLIDGWVEDALDRAPNLLYIDDYCGNESPFGDCSTLERAPITGFRFVTYKNGGETLYHARKSARYLHPATVAYYTEWVMSENIPLPEISDIDSFLEDFNGMSDVDKESMFGHVNSERLSNTWEGFKDFMGPFKEACGVGEATGDEVDTSAQMKSDNGITDSNNEEAPSANDTTRKDHAITGTGRTEDPDEYCLELTSYRGLSLPNVLLDWVSQEAGYERYCKEGKRGMELPEHVWQYLRDWEREVHMMPKGFFL